MVRYSPNKEENEMRRHNNPRRSRSRWMEQFDTEYREWPQLAHIARVVAVPLKTVYINRACNPDANIDKVIFDVDELQAFMGMWIVW